MESRWYINIVATVKEKLANRARLKADGELPIIRENVDTEMRHRQDYDPSTECHIRNTMKHCDNSSTLVMQGGRSQQCSMGNVRILGAAPHIIEVVDKAKEPDKDSGVEEEDIKLNTKAILPNVHKYAISGLGFMSASRFAMSCKIDIQHLQWIARGLQEDRRRILHQMSLGK